MRSVLFITALFFLARLSAQELPPPAPVTSPLDTLPETMRVFRAQYDNDVFHATDRYYTFGLRGEMIAPAIWKIPLTRVLLSFGRSYDEAYGISLNQRCFTPGRSFSDTIQHSDRPFAGHIYIGFKRISASAEYRVRMTSELDIGAVGPCASCEESQKIFHTWINNEPPQGWENQLVNSFAFDYSTEAEKGIISNDFFELNGHLGLQAGTVHIRGNAGLMARTGRMSDYFMRPAPADHFECWVFVRSEVQGVAFNGTLQGPLFNKGNYHYILSENVARTVFRTDGGLVLAYKMLQLEYRQTWLSREFSGGLPHGWGSVGFSCYF